MLSKRFRDHASRQLMYYHRLVHLYNGVKGFVVAHEVRFGSKLKFRPTGNHHIAADGVHGGRGGAMMRRWIFMVFLSVWFVMPARVTGITIEFDYSLDGPFPFFNASEKKQALEAAAAVYERLFTDKLAAIQPSEDNTWRVSIPNPGTGGLSIKGNMTIPADTIRIFVGGRDIPEDDIASVDVGIISGFGTSQWSSIVQERGQPNALGLDATDVGPWGGAMAFDTQTPFLGARKWHFDVDSLPASDEYDMFSAVLHEIPKVLGFGTADSWDRLVDPSDDLFNGPNAMQEFGGPVPLDETERDNPTHWAPGTVSQIYGDGAEQTALNTRVLLPGTRIFPTDLDVAALQDIGWAVAPPAPALQAGDADQDRDFDQLDLIQVQIAAKYLAGQAATWGEGDWNGAPGGSPGDPPSGDGVFDQLDIVAALSGGKYLTGPYASLRPEGEKEPTGRGETVFLSDLSIFGSMEHPRVRMPLDGSQRVPVDSVYLPVPEPASILLLSIGFVLFVVCVRQRYGGWSTAPGCLHFSQLPSWTAPLSMDSIRRLTAPQRSLPANTVAIMFGYPPANSGGKRVRATLNRARRASRRSWLRATICQSKTGWQPAPLGRG